MVIKNDCPMAWAALSDMASHLFSPFLLFERSETLARVGNVSAETEPLNIVRECRSGTGAHGIGPSLLVLPPPNNQKIGRSDVNGPFS